MSATTTQGRGGRQGARQGAATGRQSRLGVFPIMVIGLLAIGLMFGGASRVNLLQASVVEVAALLLLPFAVWRWAEMRLYRSAPVALTILAAMVLIAVLQLIPLSPGLWSALPERQLAQDVYATAKLPLPLASISVAPALTLRSALSLAPPIVMFLATATLSAPARRRAVLAILLITVVGRGLGLLQITGGSGSGSSLTEITKRPCFYARCPSRQACWRIAAPREKPACH
jgi:hypothetical protein